MCNLWYQLSQLPEIEAKLHAELDRVLGGRAFGPEDLQALHYGEMVVKETLRVFPPAPVLYREILEDHELEGVPLKKGDYVLVYSHLLHFDANNFEEPRRFWPDRFDTEQCQRASKFAYLPFGAGPRVCMGQALSMLETRSVLATIAQEFRLLPIEGRTIEPRPFLTDGKEHPMYMRVAPRQDRHAPSA
jgi:cytochrome P450